MLSGELRRVLGKPDSEVETDSAHYRTYGSGPLRLTYTAQCYYATPDNGVFRVTALRVHDKKRTLYRFFGYDGRRKQSYEPRK